MFPLFPQFLALPSELRLKIWQNAFSTPRVIAFVPGRAEQNQNARSLAQSVDLSITSQACREARCVYERMHHRMVLQRSEELIVPSLIWLACSETVFYLGNNAAIEAVLNLLSSRPPRDHIQHVAVGWSTFRDLIILCKRLSVFHRLQTFTILMPAGQGVCHPLTSNDRELASLAASAHSHDGTVTGLSAPEFDTDYLGAIVKDVLSSAFQQWSQGRPEIKIAPSEFI